jgi:hypothetical protein
VNNGGDMVEATIRMVDPNVSYTKVHASRGKVIRAEPVAALYEQRRVHHIGSFPMLEDQQCGFTTDFDWVAAGFSPDRVDALVWALTDLLVEPMAHSGIFELYREQARASDWRLLPCRSGMPRGFRRNPVCCSASRRRHKSISPHPATVFTRS